MKITVIRKTFTEKSTIGEMLIDGEFQCFVLEDADRKLEENINAKVQGSTAIPRGTYKVTIDFSNRFQRDMPHIENVPQFSAIRIHSGNFASDTEGCLLVGTGINGHDAISNSRAAFSAFFAKLEAAINTEEEVTIEIL